MERIKKRLKYMHKSKPNEYFCCSQYGFLFHDYTEFQEFIDTGDDAPSDIGEL